MPGPAGSRHFNQTAMPLSFCSASTGRAAATTETAILLHIQPTEHFSHIYCLQQIINVFKTQLLKLLGIQLNFKVC